MGSLWSRRFRFFQGATKPRSARCDDVFFTASGHSNKLAAIDHVGIRKAVGANGVCAAIDHGGIHAASVGARVCHPGGVQYASGGRVHGSPDNLHHAIGGRV